MADGVKLYNSIVQLFQAVNLQLSKRPIVRGTVTERVCWVRSGAKGSSIVFPVRFFGNQPKVVGPYEVLSGTPPEFVNFAARMNPVAVQPEHIPVDTLIADLYGAFQSNAEAMQLQAGNEFEYQLAQFIGTGDSATPVVGANGVISGGPTEYDGLPFFHASKLVNPNRASAGTFGNIATATDPDKAGLLKAFQHLDGVLGPDGRPLRMPGKIVVVVSNESQWDMAATYLNGTIRANASAGASESNVDADKTEGGEGGGLKGRAELVKLTDLNQFGSGKLWAAFKIASAEHRPLTCNIVKPVTLSITGLDPNDLLASLDNGVRTGWRANFGLGYAWPQLAFLGKQA